MITAITANLGKKKTSGGSPASEIATSAILKWRKALLE
jgi:hypothetical protein